MLALLCLLVFIILQYGESGTSNFLKLVDYDVSASLVTKDRDIFDQIVNQVNVQENLIDVLLLKG